MIRLLLLPLLLMLSTCNLAHAGYSIYVAPQIPEFITVTGPYGSETVLNSEQPLSPAYGREICRPNNYSPHSSEPLRRSRVFENAAGIAASADLFSVCPQLRALKEKEIRNEGERRLSAIANPYMSAERETWPVQMKEAEDCLFDPVNCNPPMLTAMATSRGIAVMDLVGKVWENVTLFRHATGLILGIQQRFLDTIAAETDFSQLNSIKWPD